MKRFVRDQRGATAAEYTVVLVAVLLIVVGAFRLMGSQVSKTSDKATIVLGGSGASAGGMGGTGNTVGGSVGAGAAVGASGGEKGGAGTAANTGPTSGPGATGGGTAVGNMGASGGGGGARGASAGGAMGGRSAVGEKTSVATGMQGGGAVTNHGGIGAGGGGGGGTVVYGGGRVLTPEEEARNNSGGDLEDFGKQKFGRWIALVFLLMGLVIAFFTLKKSKGQMAGGTNMPGGGGSNLG